MHVISITQKQLLPINQKITVKTITIRDGVYKKLIASKSKDESFSELFERLLEGSNSTEILDRLRGCVEFSNKEKLLSWIRAAREGTIS